jgi:glycine/D-amino acid oxidase-like deaminating enzyme/nitrite reductase/ring-hydroxylating ferredoxin subunit
MTAPPGGWRLPGKPISLWMATTPPTAYPPLAGMVDTDVAVLGAGITGVTAAVRLREAGKRVVLVDAREVVAGATGNTTAKITALHSLAYRTLTKRHGQAKAGAYAAAQQWALRTIGEWVRDRGIACDLEPATAYTYAETAEEAKLVEEEVEAARAAGLPVRLTRQTDLPYPIETAVALDDQAHFHPRKYLLALLDRAAKAGLEVLEQTTALEIKDGKPCVVTTDRGEIRAGTVIVATHQPFPKQGGYYAKLTLKRSFALAVQVAGRLPRGMYISVATDFRSMRPQRVDGHELLIVGGGRHATGQAQDTANLVRELEVWARQNFEVLDIPYRWATQDNVTQDGLPYVGRMDAGSPRVLMATGFGGWGMTNGTVAGHLLADLVLGQTNPWADLFDPARLGLVSSVAGLVKDTVLATKDLVGTFDTAKEDGGIAPGEGRVTSWGFDKVAVHRDEAGVLHRVSAVCTHMQCLVRWNSAERSWDCPCHGSRFAPDGKVLQGPATKPLAPAP